MTVKELMSLDPETVLTNITNGHNHRAKDVQESVKNAQDTDIFRPPGSDGIAGIIAKDWKIV